METSRTQTEEPTLHGQLAAARRDLATLDASPPITQPGEAQERCNRRAYLDSEIAALTQAIEWNASMGNPEEARR